MWFNDICCTYEIRLVGCLVVRVVAPKMRKMVQRLLPARQLRGLCRHYLDWWSMHLAQDSEMCFFVYHSSTFFFNNLAMQ